MDDESRETTLILKPGFIPKAFSSLSVGHALQGLDQGDRKSTRLNSSHSGQSRMPSAA